VAVVGWLQQAVPGGHDRPTDRPTDGRTAKIDDKDECRNDNRITPISDAHSSVTDHYSPMTLSPADAADVDVILTTKFDTQLSLRDESTQQQQNERHSAWRAAV